MINAIPTRQNRILLLEQAKAIIIEQIKDSNTTTNPNHYQGLQKIMVAYHDNIMNPTQEHAIIFANIVATMYDQSNDPILQSIRETVDSQLSPNSFISYSYINEFVVFADNADWSMIVEKQEITSPETNKVLKELTKDILEKGVEELSRCIECVIDNDFGDDMLVALDGLFEEYKLYHERYMHTHASQHSREIQNLSLYQFHRLFYVHNSEHNQNNIINDDHKYDITNLFFEFLAAPILNDFMHKMIIRIDYELEELRSNLS